MANNHTGAGQHPDSIRTATKKLGRRGITSPRRPGILHLANELRATYLSSHLSYEYGVSPY